MLAEKLDKVPTRTERQEFLALELWRFLSPEQTIRMVGFDRAMEFGVRLASHTMSQSSMDPIQSAQRMMWQRWVDLCMEKKRPRRDIAHVIRLAFDDDVFSHMPGAIQVASLCILAESANDVVQAVRVRESMIRQESFRTGDYRTEFEHDEDPWGPSPIDHERSIYVCWWESILSRGEEHVGKDTELDGG